MIPWHDKRILTFQHLNDVNVTPKKRMFPERNLHYVSHNSVFLPQIPGEDDPILSKRFID